MSKELVVGEVYDIYTVLDKPVAIDGKKGLYYKVRCSCDGIVMRKRKNIVPGTSAHRKCQCKLPKHMTIHKDEVYHWLTVTGDKPIARYNGNKRSFYIECRCECGVVKPMRIDHILNGRSKSCGCYAKSLAGEMNRSHGLSQETIIYNAWSKMMHRCYDLKDTNYPNYGGRGITVDESLKDVTVFYKLLAPTWAPGLTLDRIDVDGNYTPDNLRWATPREQANNKRNTIYIIDPFNNDKISLKQLSARYDVGYKTLTNRYYAGKEGIALLLGRSDYYQLKWPKLSAKEQQGIISVIATRNEEEAMLALSLKLLDVRIIKYYHC